MEQLEKIIQLVTDRVMEQLEKKESAVSSSQSVFSFMGKTQEDAAVYYQQQGFRQAAFRDIHSPQILILSELPLYRLTRMAHLAPIDEMEEKLLERILNKQTLVILEEGMEYTQRKSEIPKAMQAVFEKAKLELRKWGVQYLNKNDLVRSSTSTGPAFVPASPQKKELFTVAKIRNMNLTSHDVFYITPNMIVTSLAKDYLREQRIQIEERDR